MATLRKKIRIGLILWVGVVALSAVLIFQVYAFQGTETDFGNEFLNLLRTRLALWAVVTLIATGAFWIWLLRSAVIPLARASAAIKEIAKGRLNGAPPEGPPDELDEIGSSVNELAVNVQETLLYIWRRAGDCQRLLDDASRDLASGSQAEMQPVLERIEESRKAINDMRSFIETFEFYDIHFDAERNRLLASSASSEQSN